MPIEFTRDSGARTGPAKPGFDAPSLLHEHWFSRELCGCLVSGAMMRAERDQFAATYEMYPGEIVVLS